MTKGLGEAAANLSWLSPCAASLVALARAPTAATWGELRCDPGCVLLLLRHALPAGAPAGLSFFPSLLRDPAPVDAALRHLAQPGPGFVDFDQPPFRPVYNACLTTARLASLLAERCDGCDPDNAWVAGLLAPLGWLALCAADPARATVALARASPPCRRPGVPLSEHDPAAIARRLNRLWRLPTWLGTVTGHLGLPAVVAHELGADPGLFRVVQLAAGLARAQGADPRLAVGAAPEPLTAELGLTVADVEQVKRRLMEQPPRPRRWQPPAELTLLPELLRLAADNRRLGDGPGLDALQQDVDALQRAIEGQCAGEAGRLQALKLAALAELAAGAGHEINNPLAVISGQAQYLLAREADSGRRRSLQTIIGQANRIHQTLTELMQFARPPAPKKQAVDVGGLMRCVADGLRELAEQREVRLLLHEPALPLTLHTDPGQVQVALRCLLRNAIEAAPSEGWASVRAREDGETVELVVEDSGAGPSAADREHLFDPFYSGRKAGRGRGLGLPTAWRLAREHGGDVLHDDAARGPTRFLLRLPRCHARPQEPVPAPALMPAPDSSLPADEPESSPPRNGTPACPLAPPAA